MDANSSTPNSEKKTVEDWAAQKSISAWLFAAVRAYERWAEGTELTEAEFEAALARVHTLQFR